MCIHLYGAESANTKQTALLHPPDSRLDSDSDRPHHSRHSNLVYISCYQSSYTQNFQFFPHCTTTHSAN
jgi:hypothetical protein